MQKILGFKTSENLSSQCGIFNSCLLTILPQSLILGLLDVIDTDSWLNTVSDALFLSGDAHLAKVSIAHVDDTIACANDAAQTIFIPG